VWLSLIKFSRKTRKENPIRLSKRRLVPKDLALDRSAWKIAIHVPEPWLLMLGFNSSLPQLVWDLKTLLLLLSAQRTTEEEYKHQDNQHSEVIEKGTIPKENWRRVEKSKNIQYSNYSAQIHCHGCWRKDV